MIHMDEKQHPHCSIVASVYNEEAGIEAFYEEVTRVAQSLGYTYELIFVNDGSKDNSLSLLTSFAEKDNNVKVVDFSRNYGHEAAMIAGIDYAKGDFIVCMDSDLQHPPQYISEINSKIEEGFDVVTMVRKKREDASAFQEFRSLAFYKLMNKISEVTLDEKASDFFAISKRVAEILRTDYRERTRFLRGIIQIVGFKKSSIEYVAQKRFAGKSNYFFFKLVKLSFSAISSFSNMPLRLGMIAGSVFGVMGLGMLVYSLVMWFIDTPVSGYTTLVVFMCLFASVQLFIVGLIGQYVGYIFDEVKSRPTYIVKNVVDHAE